MKSLEERLEIVEAKLAETAAGWKALAVAFRNLKDAELGIISKMRDAALSPAIRQLKAIELIDISEPLELLDLVDDKLVEVTSVLVHGLDGFATLAEREAKRLAPDEGPKGDD